MQIVGKMDAKSFNLTKERREAVFKYCEQKATSMEEIALTYGYPIDKWMFLK
jgi:hypothetical protein